VVFSVEFGGEIERYNYQRGLLDLEFTLRLPAKVVERM